MINLSNYKELNHAFKAVFYGAPKTGKTLLMGQLARDFRVLWIDLESGLPTLIQMLPPEYLAKIDYICLPDTPKNTCAVETLLKMFESTTPGTICEKHGTWNCDPCKLAKAPVSQIDMNNYTADKGWVICVDSGSQFALSAFNQVCNKCNITLADGDKASFAIWGMQGAYIEKLFSMVQNGKWNFALSAHEMEVEMPDKSKKLAPSVGTRKVAANFGKYFDHIVRLSISGGKHKVASLTTDAPMCETGSRYNIDLSKPNSHVCDLFHMPTGKQAGITVSAVPTPTLGGVGSALSKFAAKKP